jgi:hypothetical protein
MPGIHAFAREFDETFHSVFADKGMGAGTGKYTSPDGVETEGVRVYVNRTLIPQGEYRQQVAPALTIQYFLADCTPATGGSLLIDGETWINVEETDNDGSLSTWAVRRG